MILVDTSAWVEFDRATGSRVDRRLAHLIATTDDVAVTEPVIMEVLAGARSDRREEDLRRLLDRFALLRLDPVVHFTAAASTYRQCRRAGVTPRGLIDCLVAAVALSSGVAVLAHDRDLAHLAGIVGLPLDPDSLGALT
ncbi:MAG: type II toxin-antitoxin system VapC family toxin [Acidimicrobiales bacterium]